VRTVGRGGEGGGPGGSSSDDSRQDQQSRWRWPSHRSRRPRSFSNESTSKSDDGMVPKVLADLHIPVHKVGENLLNIVTDRNLCRLDNQSQKFTCQMRLQNAQHQ